MSADREIQLSRANYFRIPDVVLYAPSLHVSAGLLTDLGRQVIFASHVSQGTANGLTLSVPSEKTVSFCDARYLGSKVSEICNACGQSKVSIHAQAVLEVSRLISLVSDSVSFGPVTTEPSTNHVHTPIEIIFSKNISAVCDQLDDNMGVVSDNPDFYKYVLRNVAGFSKDLAKSLLSSSAISIFDRVDIESWDGYRINLYTLGDPAKKPLLLVNAYGMPVTFMEPLAQALENDFYLVTWESRGIPSSATEVSDHDLSPSAHVRDGFYIMDLLSLEKPDVIGWCTGAHIALKMALMNRERVGKLILLNGGFNFDNIQDTAFQKNMRHVMVAACRNMGLARLYHSAMYSRSEAQSSTGVADASEKTMDIFRSTDTSLVHLTGTPYASPENLFKYASMIARFIQDKDYSGMEEMGENVLILTAKDDVTTGYMGSVYLSNCIPGSKISFHPTGDHFLLYNDSEYVSNQVRAFLMSGRHAKPAVKESVDLLI
jgi:pimeloyl-ACP methyl ester carboxylesterase